MTFFRNTGLLSIADLITELETRATAEGWADLQLNNTKTAPGTLGRMTYERLWRLPGTAIQPAAGFVGMFRAQANVGSEHALAFWGASACRANVPNENGFATIATISKAPSSTLVTVTTVAPHGFANGDLVAINGVTNTLGPADGFNEGWQAASENVPNLITVTGANTFTYVSNFGAGGGGETGTGGKAVAVWNVCGSRGELSQWGVRSGSTMTLLDGAMQVFGYIDEFRMMFTVKQGGLWRTAMIGQLGRRHVQADFSDTAYASVALTAGLGVTINLVDAFGAPLPSPNLCVGQKLWLIDPVTGAWEVTTILTKPLATQITADIVNNYPIDAASLRGALIGLDPMPIGVFSNVSPNVALNLTGVQCAFFENGTRTGATSVQCATTFTYTPFIDFGGNLASVSPDANGDYQGQDIAVQRTAAPAGMRANLAGPGAIVFGVNVQTDGDLQRVGCLPTVTDYMILASQTISTLGNNGAVAYGPGAA